MGRHRRSGAAPAAEEYAAGTDSRHRGTRRKRRGSPVRTGLLGASAAVAAGAMAVASGLLPGGDTFTTGGAATSERQVETRQTPELTTQGGAARTSAAGTDGTDSRTGTGPGPGNGTAASPSAAPSTKASATPTPSRTPSSTPSSTPSAAPTRKAPPAATKRSTPPAPPKAPRTPTAVPTTQDAPKPAVTTPVPLRTTPSAPSTASRAAAAEAEVVRLVNVERAKVGCTPVRQDAELAALAGAFSADMATRGFFDHTDPDGDTPWTRAQQAGVSGMGGENIARGQVDAAAVMTSWMASDGHRANILNCDFTALGVGVHFGDGGPWWTQEFGY
ncbi:MULTISPECIES: CAP domain-containing protein [unclassified Streptomyces]|uniref:CAP domain-containing protein n=1 Tax=unclassified Streptomyces TaxID=2593676 RepID=UPI00368D70E1